MEIKPLSNEKGSFEKRVFEEHFLKRTFVFNREFMTVRTVITFLMYNGVDDVEENFIIDFDNL